MCMNGGNRIGAGRPKGSVSSATLATQAARKRFMERFIPRQDKIYDALFALAEGVVIVDGKDSEGKPIIFRKAPDRESLKILIEQGIGRPQQTVDVDMKGETKYVIQRAGDTDTIAQPPVLNEAEELAVAEAMKDEDVSEETE